MEVYSVESSEENFDGDSPSEWDGEEDDGPNDDVSYVSSERSKSRSTMPAPPRTAASLPTKDAEAQCAEQPDNSYIRDTVTAILSTLGGRLAARPATQTNASSDASGALRSMRRLCASLVPPTRVPAASQAEVAGAPRTAFVSDDLLNGLFELTSQLKANASLSIAQSTTPQTPLSPLPPSEGFSSDTRQVLQQLFQQLAAHMSVASRPSITATAPSATEDAIHVAEKGSIIEQPPGVMVSPDVEGILRQENTHSITALYQELLHLRGVVSGGQAAERAGWATTALEANCRQLQLELKHLEARRLSHFRSLTHQGVVPSSPDELEHDLGVLCRLGARLRQEHQDVAQLLASVRGTSNQAAQHRAIDSAAVPRQVHDLQREEIKRLTKDSFKLQDLLRVAEERAARAEAASLEAAKGASLSSSYISERIGQKIDKVIAEQRAGDMRDVACIASALLGRRILNIYVPDDSPKRGVVAVDALQNGAEPEEFSVELGDDLPSNELALQLARALIAHNEATSQVLPACNPATAEAEDEEIEPPATAASLFYDNFEEPDDEPFQEVAQSDSTVTDAVVPVNSASLQSTVDLGHEVEEGIAAAITLTTEVVEPHNTTVLREAASVDPCEASADGVVAACDLTEIADPDGGSSVEPFSPVPQEACDEGVSAFSEPSRKRSRSVSPQRRGPSPRVECPTEVSASHSHESEVLEAQPAHDAVEVTAAAANSELPAERADADTAAASEANVDEVEHVAEVEVHKDLTPQTSSSTSTPVVLIPTAENLFAEVGFWEDDD